MPLEVVKKSAICPHTVRIFVHGTMGHDFSVIGRVPSDSSDEELLTASAGYTPALSTTFF